MQVEYIDSQRLWRMPDFGIKFSCLGQAILSKLKEDDPQRVLEIHYDSGVQLTVQDVRRQTITVAQNMMRLGVKKGDTVILYSMVNDKITPITFACYTIGAPVNFFETTFEGGAISETLEQLDPTVIIYENEYKPQLFKALERIKLLKLKHVLSIDFESPSVSEVLFEPGVDIESFEPPTIGDPASVPATLMLTSGSSGFPKIALHSHAMMMQGLYTWWELGPKSVIFCFSPLRWISQVSMMMQAVFFGVKRVYASKPATGAYGMQVIDKYKVTHFFTVPQIYLQVLRAADHLKDFSCLSSLKKALVGGEVVSDSLVTFSAKIAPQCRVIKCYGMTELAGVIASDELISNCRVNGGAFKKGLMAKILDDDHKPLGPNEKGRLCLKSTVPFLGYFKNKKANEEGFIGDGWFSTGDYGLIDSDNLLNIVTRHMYLLRAYGTIVIPNHVENIVNGHPYVLSSALVGHPNPSNPTDDVGTVFVVLRTNTFSKHIEDDLKEFTEKKLTKEEVQIVRYFKVIPQMPLTCCGKVDRMALKEIAKGRRSLINADEIISNI